MRHDGQAAIGLAIGMGSDANRLEFGVNVKTGSIGDPGSESLNAAFNVRLVGLSTRWGNACQLLGVLGAVLFW